MQKKYLDFQKNKLIILDRCGAIKIRDHILGIAILQLCHQKMMKSIFQLLY